MRAINVVDKMREFVVGDGALIVLENIPFRFAAENTEVVSGATSC